MDGALPSIWASLYGWFSPTVLFVLRNIVIVLLNIVIGTIAVTSKVGGRRGEAEEGGADQPDEQRKIARTPSAIFGRLRSFKLSRQPTFEIGTATTETITHHESPPPAAAADAPQQEHQSQFIRSQSDAQPTAGEMPPKLPAKLKKSASAKSAFAHFEAKDMVPVPAPEEEEEEEEEVKEVDAKADAFINRFRQQLHLQRLDSILRYKEMLHRGR